MKVLLLILIISSVISLNCQNSTEPVQEPELADVFRIDLQGGFSLTPVQVKLDNTQIFFDTVSTGSILAFAAVIPVQIYKGTHTLSVTVDNLITKSTTFNISDSLYAGVNYNKNNSEVTIIFREEPFGYR